MSQFQTFAYLLGRSLKTFFDQKNDPRLLLQHQLIITDDHGYKAILENTRSWLQLMLLNKCVLYRDPYGVSNDGPGALWQAGPDMLPGRNPKVTCGDGKTRMYLFDDQHVDEYAMWRQKDLARFLCAGLFDDDFGYDAEHLAAAVDGDLAELVRCWGTDWQTPDLNRATMRDWNRRRMEAIEMIVGGHCHAKGKIHVINGYRRVSKTTQVLWEGFGPAGDARFWSNPAKLEEYGAEGDMALVRCLGANGEIVEDLVDEVLPLLTVAANYKMLVGLSFLEYPADNRGSKRSFWEPLNQWPEMKP